MTKVDISEWIKEVEEKRKQGIVESLPTLEELDQQSKLLKESGVNSDLNWEETLKAKLQYLNRRLAEAVKVLKK